jgi:hypothetical protein
VIEKLHGGEKAHRWHWAPRLERTLDLVLFVQNLPRKRFELDTLILPNATG